MERLIGRSRNRDTGSTDQPPTPPPADTPPAPEAPEPKKTEPNPEKAAKKQLTKTPPMPTKYYLWPEDHPPAPAPVQWPQDHDQPASNRSAPPNRKAKTVTTTNSAPRASANDYAPYLDQSTPGTQAEKLENAAAAASRDADAQETKAEAFRVKARRIDGIPAMADEAEGFRSEARKLDQQAVDRRDIATRFRDAASAKATA